MNTKKLTVMSLFLGLSLIIFIVEAQLPPIVPFPGVKPGLANIVVLMTLYIYGRREALAVLVLRIVLGCVFTGNFAGFIYSISGGAVSLTVMSMAAVFLKENRMWVVSVMGAIGHNAGQIAAAVIVMRTPQIMWYLPVLVISAVITGAFTGTAAQLSLRRLRKTGIL